MICETCKKEFHYCSNCDDDVFMDNKFCSIKCFEKSELFLKIKDFICNLNYEDILLLYNYGDLVNFYAEGYVEEEIKEKE